MFRNPSFLCFTCIIFVLNIFLDIFINSLLLSLCLLFFLYAFPFQTGFIWNSFPVIWNKKILILKTLMSLILGTRRWILTAEQTRYNLNYKKIEINTIVPSESSNISLYSPSWSISSFSFTSLLSPSPSNSWLTFLKTSSFSFFEDSLDISSLASLSKDKQFFNI